MREREVITSRSIAAGLIVLTFCLGARPAGAQERLFVLQREWQERRTMLTELDTSYKSFGASLRRVVIPPAARVIRMAGARYLAFVFNPSSSSDPLPRGVVFVDTRSFAIVATRVLSEYGLIEADRFRPRLFYRTTTEVGVMEPPTFEPRALRVTPDIANALLLETDRPHHVEATNTLFVSRRQPHSSDTEDFLVIDAESGADRGVMAVHAFPTGFVVDNEARRLYLPISVPLGTAIRRYNLDTLSLEISTPRYQAFEVNWSFDATRQHLLASSVAGRAWAVAFDSNLAPVALVDFRYLQPAPILSLNVHPSTIRDRTFAAVSWDRYVHGPFHQDIPGQAFLVVLDARSLAPLRTFNLVDLVPGLQPTSTGAFLLQPPPPPLPLSAHADDRRVELTWRNPGDATHFIVEAGTIPGRSNVGMFHVGNVTTWAVENVPPGTYYVRVRAVNDVGLSLPSNEVAVSVR